jgi:hypothetical protein
MIAQLRDVLEKQIIEFKQLVNNRFCMLQRQQNIFLQFILEYAVSSVQSDDVRIVIISLLVEKIEFHF